MTHRPANRVTRNLVVQRWGTPQETVGSVNEPREMTEHGLRFNERWIYRNPKGEPGHPLERVLYWHRYDFMGSYVRDRSGAVTPEDLRALLAGLEDRRYDPRLPTAQHRG